MAENSAMEKFYIQRKSYMKSNDEERAAVAEPRGNTENTACGVPPCLGTSPEELFTLEINGMPNAVRAKRPESKHWVGWHPHFSAGSQKQLQKRLKRSNRRSSRRALSPDQIDLVEKKNKAYREVRECLVKCQRPSAEIETGVSFQGSG